MTETIEASGSTPDSYRTRGWCRFWFSLSAIVLVLISTIAGLLLGVQWDYHVVRTAMGRNVQLKSENDKLKAEIASKNAAFAGLQAQLATVQAAIDSMVPSQNVYSINANQSLIVAGGILTIGVIGSPAYRHVEININGKQQLVAAGDIIHLAPDASTACEVRVMSFDMFRVVITAKCAAVGGR